MGGNLNIISAPEFFQQEKTGERYNKEMPKSFFYSISAAPQDPILDLTLAFNADQDRIKISLSVCVYRDHNLKTPILRSVKKAEVLLLEAEQSKEYLPGMASFQGAGGTGSFRLGSGFFKQEVGDKIVLSAPTWPNHQWFFLRCGLKIETYPYYNVNHHTLDFEKCVQFFQNLSPGTVVLMHACCHNPTGVDWSIDQWKLLSKLFLERGLITFFRFCLPGIWRFYTKRCKGPSAICRRWA